MTAALDLVGQMAPLRVRLDRGIDRAKPCHNNIAIIGPGTGPHAAELRCATCNAHRGWMRAEALTFIENLAQHWSAPAEPLILRDTTIGDHQMATERKFESKPNTGALFRNTQKRDGHDTDYRGELNIEGTAYWVSGWINTSKQSGQKYLKLSLKLKPADAATANASAGGPAFDDEIPFSPEWRG